MNPLLAALLAATSPLSAAQAQSARTAETPPGLTLEQALDLAGATAPSLDAAGAGVDAARAAQAAAGLRPNPILTVEAENVAGTGLYADTKSLEATTSLALPLELGGKRSARLAVAGAQRDRAFIEQAVARVDLRFAVTRAYAEAAASERRLTNARDQLRIAGEGLHAAHVRLRAGRASPMEVQRAELARINAQAALVRMERSAEAARFILAQRIGQAIPGALDAGWFDRIGTAHGPLQPLEPIETLALAAADADLAASSAQVRLARTQRIPDLTVGAGVRRLEATNDSAALFSLSLPLPFLNGGKAAVGQALAEHRRAEAQRRATAQEVAQAIAQAQAEAANAAIGAETATGPALAAAEEAARIARIGYREGKFSQLDLLDAERTLTETKAAAIEALLAYHNARAQLERLTARAPDQGDDR
ncbi:transporter [Sphingobium sp. 22B]|uniref:TolC family protein n=1 Tax=unclassified Sphingobium TaxID=2611147 RepID=UPI000783304C|nr:MULTISPECIES: TolC family protein [unclassified Sphingobium]KXU32677.1 transporter [Sphingobium sp. AM]KYC32754.1 transporter [Sphingobium sp. 22B]OAP31643.1 transporter [Sphingobium sp. 20006FA]